jgi:hypothetical protein
MERQVAGDFAAARARPRSSEIRLGGRRRMRVFIGVVQFLIVMLNVFGADAFHCSRDTWMGANGGLDRSHPTQQVLGSALTIQIQTALSPGAGP